MGGAAAVWEGAPGAAPPCCAGYYVYHLLESTRLLRLAFPEYIMLLNLPSVGVQSTLR